jgi:hypothetical protein
MHHAATSTHSTGCAATMSPGLPIPDEPLFTITEADDEGEQYRRSLEGPARLSSRRDALRGGLDTLRFS